MTNDQSWSPPSGEAAAAPSPWAIPAASTPVAPAPPPGGQQSTPGWAPPPKPGLIPLRPLSFGTIIGSSFKVMRRNPAPTFGLSILLYGFITVVYLGLIGALFALAFGRVSSAAAEDQNDILAGSIGLVLAAILVPVTLAVVATGVLQGIISLEVSRATLGEKLKLRGLWRLAKGRLGSLIGWTLILSAAVVLVTVIATIATFAVFAGAMGGSSGSDPSGVLAAVLGAVFASLIVGGGFVVLSAWIGTKTSLVPSVIMLERLTLRESLRRSWQLTDRNFWRTLGVQLLIGVIVYLATYIVSIPVYLVGTVIGLLVNPNADPEAFTVTFVVMYILIGVVTVVVGAIGLVMQSASLALIYIDIRMRKEGLDLELLHYVEAKQAGAPGVDNPYLRLQSGEADGTPSASVMPGSPWA